MFGFLNRCLEDPDVRHPLRGDNTMFGKMTAQCVDELRALSNQ